MVAVDIKGALLPEEVSSRQRHPKTIAWLKRYREAFDAKKKAIKPKRLEGKDAVDQILAGEFAEPEGQVDGDDVSGLKKEDDIEAWPVDTGFMHRDVGKLVALTRQETVVEAKSEMGIAVRVHHPGGTSGSRNRSTIIIPLKRRAGMKA